ncbi:MAG: hypothetical protein Q9M45_12075 [Robiginitomaculum sp.]|nr:hypothetical protein [Robiginitomaculum sp.]
MFESVINSGTNPAQNCTISLAAGAPVNLAYQRTNAANAPIGPADAIFDVKVGETLLFVLSMTPAAVSTGMDLFPKVLCDNAGVGKIPGVNTVFITIAGQQIADILSISATLSGDNIINTPHGGIGVMTASAINIGAGDTAGSSDAAVSVSVDTGAVQLPLLLQICQTDAASVCLPSSPLGPGPVSTVIGSAPAFFAVFVTDQSANGVPLDPANARVFLRFTNAAGQTYSVTSAAVTVAAPAADAPVMASSLPEGRWAVMVRSGEGRALVQHPGVLYVRKGGEAWLESGGGTLPMLLRAANDNTPGHFSGLAGKGVVAGQFVPGYSMFMVTEEQNTRLDIWGVHDVRPVPGR